MRKSDEFFSSSFRISSESIAARRDELPAIVHFDVAAVVFRRFGASRRHGWLGGHRQEFGRHLWTESHRRRAGFRLVDDRPSQTEGNQAALAALSAIGTTGRAWLPAGAEAVSLAEAAGVAAHDLVSERAVVYAAGDVSEGASAAAFALLAFARMGGAADRRREERDC